MSKYKDTFIALIRNNDEIMKDLALIRELHLPDWYVAAGYVRNYIWDSLHGTSRRTPLNDIDVIYFNAEELDEEIEKQYEQQLQEKTGSTVWSVKNQARMHIRNGDQPYTSIEDAMSHWPETVTAVGIRLEEDNRITYVSPYGIDDIFEFRIRRSPKFEDESVYQSRVAKKNWRKIWPKLEIL